MDEDGVLEARLEGLADFEGMMRSCGDGENNPWLEDDGEGWRGWIGGSHGSGSLGLGWACLNPILYRLRIRGLA
jgi:hypothetical protein